MAGSQSRGMPLAFYTQCLKLARIAGTTLLFALSFFSVVIVSPAHAAAECTLEPGGANCDNQQTDPGSAVPTPTGRHVGNPIDVVSGNKYQRADDFAAFASPLVYVRHYNTALVHQNIGIGPGWRDTYSLRLYQAGNTFTLVQSDGRVLVFNQLADDGVTRITSSNNDGRLVVVKNDDGADSTQWQLNDGRVWTFSGSYPVSLSRTDGTGLTLQYQNRRLSRVIDDQNESLQFFYTDGRRGLSRYDGQHDGTQPGHLRCLLLPDGTGVRYTYDTNGNLTNAQHPDGIDWEYAYEDERFTSHVTKASRHSLQQRNSWGCEEFVAGSNNTDETRIDPWASRWEFDAHGRANFWSRDLQGQSIAIEYDVEYQTTDTAENAYATEVRQSGVQDVYRYLPATKDEITSGRTTTVQKKSCEDCEWETVINLSSVNTSQVAGAQGAGVTGTGDNVIGESNYQIRRRMRDSLNASNITTVVNRFGSIQLEIPDSVLAAIESRVGSRENFVVSETDDTICKAWLKHTPIDELSDFDNFTTATENYSCKRIYDVLLRVALTIDSTNPIPMGSDRNDTRGVVDFFTKPHQPGPLGTCELPLVMTCEELEEAIEYAEISLCAYGESACPSEWVTIDPNAFGIPPEMFNIGGFSATLLYNESTNEYILSFAGTTPTSVADWVSNIQNSLDLFSPLQYQSAVALAEEVVQQISVLNYGADLTFTGHSLGGGLATIAALDTGNEAIVFNAAAVGQNAIDHNEIDISSHLTSIDVINTSGDPLSNAQQGIGWPAQGTHTTIGDPAAETLLDSHGMSAVLTELNYLYSENCNQGAS